VKKIGDLERGYVLDVLDSQFKTSMGAEYMTRFENAFKEKFKSKFAISHVNGTATMHSVLEAAGIGIGDEVIVPPLTMAATSLAVLHANATPVFADVDIETFNIDAKSIEKRITKKTKAIITVALYGLSPDMDPIMSIAKKNNLLVIEDNAQAFLSYYKGRLAGTIGDAASFSFQSSKHLSSGEGGVTITNDENLALGIRKVTGLGYKSIGAKKARIKKDDIQHPSFERHDYVGWNYRMSELNCAVALAQTERADELINQRKKIGKIFKEATKGFEWFNPQYVGNDYESSYWAFACRLETDHVSWDDFRWRFLNKGGDKYYGAWKLTYLEPLFKNKMFRHRKDIVRYDYKSGLCPNAEVLQPQIKQFKTNYMSITEAKRQAEILNSTLRFFDV
jgi:perosamine synthetase